jgi:anti-anti-sigma factor
MLTNNAETVLTIGADSPVPLTARLVAATGVAFVELAGELTRETGLILVQAVRTALLEGYRDLRVDLRDVTFLDARGLAVCTVTVRMAAEAESELTFENAAPWVARALAIGGLYP